MEKILVRMPNWIGDLVMATPILADLREAYPKAHITALCRSPLCELLEKEPHIDEIFSFRRPSSFFEKRREKRDIIEKLRQGNHEVAILTTNSFSSAYWAWEAGIPRRIGFRDHFRSLFLTDAIDAPKNLEETHQVDLFRELLKPLGIKPSKSMPKLYLDENEIKRAKELLHQQGYQEGKKLIGVHPGAAYGDAKCWPKERFIEVSEKLLENPNYHLLFFGDDKSASLVKEITRKLGPRAMDLAGMTSLRELAAIIQCCNLLLTNDSGPMHMAAALDVEVVALFGSTNPQKTGPYKKGKVLYKRASCSPCYKRECPIDFRCMKSIEAGEVASLITSMLETKDV